MQFPHKIDDKHWLAHARDLLRPLQRQSKGTRYTLAHSHAEGRQFPFQSALHALVYRWFDGDMAADELRSATAQQVEAGEHAGRIPDFQYWPAAEQPSLLAAPPLLAFAGVAVYHMTGDSNMIERLYPRVSAAHDWFDRRAVNGLVIPSHWTETLRGVHGLNVTTTEYAAVPRDILELNILRAADLDAVAHLASDMGRKAEVDAWEERAQTVRRALSDASGHDPLNPLLLFAEAVTPQQAADISARLLADDTLWVPERDGEVSLLYNWLIYVGLRHYDLRRAANRIAELALQRVEYSGDYALFDAAAGEGIGQPGASLTALAVDMLFRERQSIPPGAHCV